MNGVATGLFKKIPRADARGFQAGGQGFEPWLTVPETAVLPLDEPPTPWTYYTRKLLDVNWWKLKLIE